MKPEFPWLSPAVCTLVQADSQSTVYARLAAQPVQVHKAPIDAHLALLPNHALAPSRMLGLLTRASSLWGVQLIRVGKAFPLLLRITRSPAWQFEVFQLDQGSVLRIGYLFAIHCPAPAGVGLSDKPQASLFILDFRLDFFQGQKLGTYLLTLLQRLALHVEQGAAITGELSAQDDVERLTRFYQRLGFEVSPSGNNFSIMWLPAS